MKKSRFTDSQIIGFIKQADAGMAVAELSRQHCNDPVISCSGATFPRRAR